MAILFKRSEENPILVPNAEHAWEADAVFNGCPVAENGKIHFLYRAVSSPQPFYNVNLQISSIGYASSKDGIHFKNRRQFIKPEHDWERFGCEDPRVTKLNGKYYAFYTALSEYPFRAEGIKVALAVTKNFKAIDAKRLVTPFNAKAMALFPARINGKIAAVLSVNTDNPPAKIAVALFDREEQMWSREYWENWYSSLDHHVIFLKRSANDHIEVGAPPLKTRHGWLLLYSYIQNYFAPPATFGIEAALLDLKNPMRIVAHTEKPLLVPREEYEKYGKVPNIAFPSGALLRRGTLFLYYGAADTTCALATCKVNDLINEMLLTKVRGTALQRYRGNPLIAPKPDYPWESKATFNPAALYEGGKVHLVYRAMSQDNTSSLGYASSTDGFAIDERLDEPIYVPRESFEQKTTLGGNSGCEDPRMTIIGDTLYLCYTAFDGKNPPRVALTSIALRDFLAKRWNWTSPVLISPPDTDDKDAAIFPKKIKGKYAILHRLGMSIWIDFVDDLKFGGDKWLKGKILMSPRQGPRDSQKIGIAGPPIETEKGWLLLYHGITKKADRHYHLRAALLDLNDPTRVIARTANPILEPEAAYEREGHVPNVVFSCGAAVIKDQLFVYYGGGDKVIGVATIRLAELLEKLLEEAGSALRRRVPRSNAGKKRTGKKREGRGRRGLQKADSLTQ